MECAELPSTSHATKASRMRLSVFGIESLDSLELAVVNAFSVIPPSPNVEQLDFGACNLPLDVKDSSILRLMDLFETSRLIRRTCRVWCARDRYSMDICCG